MMTRQSLWFPAVAHLESVVVPRIAILGVSSLMLLALISNTFDGNTPPEPDVLITRSFTFLHSSGRKSPPSRIMGTAISSLVNHALTSKNVGSPDVRADSKTVTALVANKGRPLKSPADGNECEYASCKVSNPDLLRKCVPQAVDAHFGSCSLA